jgi:transcription elongation factor GreA
LSSQGPDAERIEILLGSQLDLSVSAMSTTQEQPLLTPAGLSRIEAELEHLVSVRRPEIAEDIRQSRQIGDVSENLEYAAAREAQVQVEHRISELRQLLGTARILDGSQADSGHAGLGSVVNLRDVETQEEWEVTLVSSVEADPERDFISAQCPLGEAILGKSPGEVVVAQTPGGAIRYEVLSVRPLDC